MDVLKPFLMLACVAFVTGFMGYLALARMGAPAEAPAQAWSSTVSTAQMAEPNPERPV